MASYRCGFVIASLYAFVLSSGAELISVIFGGNYGADPTVNLWLGLSIPAIFTYPIFIQFLNFKGQARSDQ